MPPSTSANTICSLDEFTASFPNGGLGTINDTIKQILANCIDAAVAELEQQIGEVYVSRTVTDTFSGNDRSAKTLRYANVSAVASVTIDGDLIDDAGYVVDGDLGAIYLTSGAFNKGIKNCVVVYTAGFDVKSGPAIPRDVWRAAMALGRAMYMEMGTQTEQLEATSLGPVSARARSSKYPPTVQRVIDARKTWRI